ANRDPAVFEDPARLHVTRAPKRHVAFGHGLHFCLGAPLARLEGQIAIGSLLSRFPDLALALPAAEYRYHRTGSIVRGLVPLPGRVWLRFGPGRSRSLAIARAPVAVHDRLGLTRSGST